MKRLAAYTRGGLADRIALLLFGERVAAATERQLEYFWPAENGCHCEFDALFFPCGFSVLNAPAHPHAARTRRGTFSETVQRIKAIHADLVHLDGFYGHDFSRFDDVFTPREAIADQVAHIQRNEFHGRSIGVHVRRTDKEMFTIPAVDEYFFAIDEELAERPESRLFFASDDPAVESLAKTRYGDRLVLYSSKSHSRHKRDGIIDALVILYLLRSCDFLITGRYSGFSLLAAWDRPCRIIHVPGSPISHDWEGFPIYRPCSSPDRWRPCG